MSHAIKIKEIYASIQGESIYAGWPCVFVRTAGCPLRCKWCDTAYAFKGGTDIDVDDIVQTVLGHKIPMVEVTGGEPLAQVNTPDLIRRLVKKNLKVLIETSGSEDISVLPVETHIVMDLKCPDSGMSHHNKYENIKCLKTSDEVKFVVASRNDFVWAVDAIKIYDLMDRCHLSFSPAWGHVDPKDLVQWSLDEKVNVRLNLQLHKYIWGPRAKSV